MAQATCTLTINHQVAGDGILEVFGTIAITANPDTYASNGLTLDFTRIASGSPTVKASRVPMRVDINAPSGYVYQYVNGTTARDGKIKILTGAAAQSALTELTNGAAIPAGVSGDTINFRAAFRGME